MNLKYEYPGYQIDLPDGIMQQCLDDVVPKLLHEVGFQVGNERFLSHLKGKPGIRIDRGRVFFDTDFVKKNIERFISETSKSMEAHNKKPEPSGDWTVTTNGYSMMTIDVETEKLREATCQDLRDMIKIANSFGIGGYYMVMPQDLPPIMQVIACYKICWGMSENISPYDYQQPEQLPFLYDMHQVMGKPMPLCLVIPTAMTIDPKDLDIFLDYYPVWKKHGNITFGVLDYPMVGISKPITIPGCATMCFAETLAVHMLFKMFDPEIELGISLHGGNATDMRNACWAFGSPRGHLFRFLNTRILPNLCGKKPDHYRISGSVNLETSSSAIDEQAALEKMATGLLAAMQGCRSFRYAGVLCVDDIYSGTQFVIDLEIVKYIREVIESFNPHPDIINIEGLYEECREVALGNDTFISHINTVKRFRNIIPSSDLIVREKVRSWMSHRKLLKDRAREIALERIKNYEPYHLPDEKQRKLDKIYEQAKDKLTK